MILPAPKSAICCNIFGIPIHWYGILMAFSFFVGIFLSTYLISKKYSKKEASIFLDFIPFAIIFAIIGARIFYVLGDINFYLNSPLEIFMINHGGLSIYGGLFFGIAAFVYFCKKNKLELFKYLDVASVAMPLCQALGRWGNYFNQEAYGMPSSGFIKLYVDFSYRKEGFLATKYFHPAFLYESALDLVLFIILLVCFLKFKNLKKGTIFYFYLMFYSIIRILVESIRIDSVLNVFNIPIAIIISFVVFGASLFLLVKDN